MHGLQIASPGTHIAPTYTGERELSLSSSSSSFFLSLQEKLRQNGGAWLKESSYLAHRQNDRFLEIKNCSRRKGEEEGD